MQYLSTVKDHVWFEELYLDARGKEKRLLDDTMVARLPYVPKEVPNYKEWEARAYSFERLKKYFQSVKDLKSLLDVGCGNGWAAARLADNKLLNVSAVDVNIEELKQADRVFQKPNLSFYYGDIFEDIFPHSSFDFIVQNSSAQYFPDLTALVQRLLLFLKDGGEIHIADTPFYKDEEIAQAKERTVQYYTSLGCPEMADHYFHHRLTDLSPFAYTVLQDKSPLSKIRSLFSTALPKNFRWVRIRKK